jgi:transcriptional regulator with XRE-family HTH domain
VYDTQKVGAKRIPYADFGVRLTSLAQKAGIIQQSQLATLLGTSQQTVSRWAAGLSRPRYTQMAQLAAALKLKPAQMNELLAAAGYAIKSATISFDQPFPIDALGPENFERFCHHLLAELYRDEGAVAHRVGGPGHKQGGLDVEVIFPDKTRWGFECKRVGKFGPDKVHAVVARHTTEADKKFLLLSRVASPQAREAIRQHDGWDIWDKDDISLRIRELPKEQQLRLVNIFFAGRVYELLGITTEGRWQTAEEFFGPFMADRGAFSHDWTLVGRTQDLETLVDKLGNAGVCIVLLTGAGGSGKSRLLKEAIEKHQSAHNGVTIRFLSATQAATHESLEELGNGEKLLVVDDAHDRSDLPVLFQHIAARTNSRLVLVFRPYGRDYIKFQASNFGLVGDCVAELKLQALDISQATALAHQVLERFNGPVGEAETIARFTLDCPLATVIGARVVSTDRKHFELAKNAEVFRTTLLGRFQDIIAGEIGSKSDADLMRGVLRVLALIQPFHTEDESIPGLVEAVEGIKAHDVSRLIHALTESGVLFKRGGQYRLSPDLLADDIIQKACIGPGGRSTEYAEKVFVAAADRDVEHLLVNLGRLDWRLANGDPANSRLLDGIWSKLSPTTGHADPNIQAVTAVAYYQPERAIRFAENLIRQNEHLRDLPELLKYAAYNLKYLPKACECLWELGKADARELNPNPSHAIRILSELCAVAPNKPLDYNEAVVDFGLSLLNRDGVWGNRYSPFDILKGILQPDGHTTTSHGRSFSIERFGVRHEVVLQLRTKVVDAVVRTLSHLNVSAAVLAARCLHEALRYPMDAGEEARRGWTKEFLATFAKIENAIAGTTDPLVLIKVAGAISWHANYGVEQTERAAQRILDSLPNTLGFRTLLALVDGYGQMLDRHEDYQKRQAEWNSSLATLAADLLRTYPSGEELRAFVEKQIAHIQAHSVGGESSPYVLYWQLINASSELARATLADGLSRLESATRQFAGMALAKLLQDHPADGLDYANQLLQSNCQDLRAAIGRAIEQRDLKARPLSSEEIGLLRIVLGSDDERIARCAIGGVRRVVEIDRNLAIELLRCVDIGISSQLADDVFMNFASNNGDISHAIGGEDIELFLNKMMGLAELDGYWIETFLSAASKNHARHVAKFFIDRVDYAAQHNDWHHRPCNYGPYGHVPLRFRESPEFGAVLRQVSEWIKSRNDLIFRERSAQLFDTMFRPFDEALVNAFQAWVDIATESDISVISKILGEAHPTFIFEQRPFIARFLAKAEQFGRKPVDGAISALIGSAIGGIRSGTPGEPFPVDLRMKQEATKAAEDLPAFSPAYELYATVARHAEASIQRSVRDGEAFEE